MASDKSIVWIVLIGIVVVIALGGLLQDKYDFFSISGTTMTRSVPSSVQPNQQFTVTYSVSGAPKKWGASIVDSVSGGCTFPAGNTLKSVLLSDEGNTKTITIKSPSSGSCTFIGDYQFGTEAIKNFLDQTTIISSGTNPTCLDGIQNQDETGIDCGGPCSACETIVCTSDSDCPTLQNVCGGGERVCSNGECRMLIAWAPPVSPCDGAVYKGYPTCGWDKSSCESTFDLNKVLFNLGSFGVTGWYLIIGFVGLMLLLNLIPKK